MEWPLDHANDDEHYNDDGNKRQPDRVSCEPNRDWPLDPRRPTRYSLGLRTCCLRRRESPAGQGPE